jgi:hypothetical protein
MRLSLKIDNLFYSPPIKEKSQVDYFYKHWTLTKNKSAEIQITNFKSFQTVFDFLIDLHWWGSDHQGPDFRVETLGVMFNIKVYDHRHWDYETHRWEE